MEKKTSALPTATSLPSSNTLQVTKRIELLFTKFGVFYGHIWRSQFKDEGAGFLVFMKKEWQEGLKEFDDAVLDKATEKCKAYSEMPPTLPALIGYCREIRKKEAAFVKEPEIPRGNAEIARSHLRQCLEKLRK